MKTNPYPLIVKAAKMLGALTLVWLLAACIFWWFWRSVSVDYSTQPAAEVFKLVLNADTPSGLTNLQVAGHGVLMGHTVWMKYTATDSAITSLMKNQKLSFDGPYNALTRVTKNQILKDRDACSIGWDKVLHLRHLESYSYAFVPSGSGWVGEIIIDCETHTVYTNSEML